jgi:hypothetical protein
MPTRILLIGNSFTARNGLPQLVADLAVDAGAADAVTTRLVFAGGASLRRHWNGAAAREAIASRSFDWVVLQEQSTLPVKNGARYQDNVRLFQPEIEASGARTALYLTWSRRNAPHAQEAITRAVEEIAAETGARVIPVGRAWHEALARHPSIELYTDDGSHPSPAGSYLAACTFVGALFGRPVTSTSVAGRAHIEAAVAKPLQAIAWWACNRIDT